MKETEYFYRIEERIFPPAEIRRSREVLRNLNRRLKFETRDAQSVEEKIDIINHCLFRQLRFCTVQSSSLSFYLTEVTNNRRGCCVGLTILYMLTARARKWPCTPLLSSDHCFIRWDSNGRSVVIDCTLGGAAIPSAATEREPCLPLDFSQLFSLYLNQCALSIYSFTNDGQLARSIMELAYQLSPELTIVAFNRGVLREEIGQ